MKRRSLPKQRRSPSPYFKYGKVPYKYADSIFTHAVRAILRKKEKGEV